MQKWYTVVTYDAQGRKRRELVGRWLTLGDALKWLWASGEPIATLFEDVAGKWQHIPWAWSGLEFYQPSKMAASSTWGTGRG